MDSEILNPLSIPEWNDLLLNTPGTSIFHSAEWARVLHDSYGYTPQYFCAIEENRFSFLFPLMEVNSRLTGKRGVSLPFTDYCEMIVPTSADFDAFLIGLLRYGRSAGWRYLEFRDGRLLPESTPSYSFYYGHTLDLSAGETTLYANLRDSTRRNINKARKEGVTVTIDTSRESVKAFHRLNCLTRRDHGLPSQPFSFFHKLHENIISKGMGFVALATFKGRQIAGAVYLHQGNQAIFKYGASEREYQHVRSNNLVMWEAIRHCVKLGFSSLCFGRTEPENLGLMQYKGGWGVKERLITYHRYDFRQGSYLTEPRRLHRIRSAVFRHMPLPLSRVLGRLLYAHVA